MEDISKIDNINDEKLIVVGIGASAGGLEALQSFVKHVPVDTNFVYLVAQHLSPTYKSLMVDLLSKDSPIEIKEAKNGEQIKADTMYICPPNKNIILEENQIILMDPKQITYGPKPSINLLFESIASNREDKGIGIILSGTGSDGSRGIRTIKAEGGFTIAQQPQNAKYDGMPNSAINTGNVDLILDVEVIGKEILEIVTYPNRNKPTNIITESTAIYKNILNKLHMHKSIDFSLYKSSTINRRIERRMAAQKITNINKYSEYISTNNDEVEALFNDILIGVTSFFRDKEAFEKIEQELRRAIKNKDNKNIRIWTPGCSTGEETYSIAMLISEILDQKLEDYKIQIFATDIDEVSAAFARAGRYPESALIDVDKKYVKKYFTIKNDEFEIIKPIRDMCIFSKHDITNDPAFMRLDLISCRNLLIYFTNELQERIFPMFHYSLNDKGILFLGKSESIGSFNNQFKMIDKKAKIYEAIYNGQKVPPKISKIFKASTYKRYELGREDNQNIPTISEMMVDHIQRHIMPMCIVVNEGFDMIFIKGKNKYLVHPEGEITQNVFKNVHSDLSVELRAGLHQCKKDSGIIKTQFVKIVLNDSPQFVRLIIVPLDNALTNDLFLISFQEEDKENLKSYDIVDSINGNSEEVERLNLELAKSREHLQTVIEELETSNEEMQSLNEELQSSNEELQSSNEELETTNEELQSTNEELQTAYTEMRAMYEERDNDAQRMAEIKTDLEVSSFRIQTVLNASKVGIFEYDILKKETTFINDTWADIFELDKNYILASKEDIMTWYENRIHDDDLEERTKLYEKLLLGKIESYEIELRVVDSSGSYKWVKSLSTVIKDNENGQIKKIINTLVDISEEKNRVIDLESLQNKLVNASKMTKIGVWEWDIQKDIVWWSDEMYSIYNINKNESLNLSLIESLIHKEDLFKHKTELQKALYEMCEFNIEYRIIVNKKVKYIWAKGSVVKEHGIAKKLVGAVQDITEQKEKEQLLLDNKNYINSIMHTSLNAMYIFDFTEKKNVYINEQYTDITGYILPELDELYENDFIKSFHKDDREKILEHMKEVFESKDDEVIEVKYRFRHKTGKYIWCLSRDIISRRDEDGNPLEMIGTFLDISAYQDDCD